MTNEFYKKTENIKIFGERNSGTRYLEELLKINLINCKILDKRHDGGSGWKHGIPNEELLSKYKNIFYIFIIRDLNGWANSMFNRPYHIKKENNFFKFLINNIVPIEGVRGPNHDSLVLDHEKNKNLFELRYFKIKKYIEFSKGKNFAFLNMKFLQDNPKIVINYLSKKLNIENKKFNDFEYHTKTGRLEKNDLSYKKYNIYQYEGINKYIDKKIENYINNLKISFFIEEL